MDPDPEITAIYASILAEHKKIQKEQGFSRLLQQFLVKTGLIDPADIREDIEVFPVLADVMTPTHAFICKWRATIMGVPWQRCVLEVNVFFLKAKEVAPDVTWGILTDGRYYITRRPGQMYDPVENGDIFVIDEPDRWPQLRDWLRAQIDSPEFGPVPDPW